MSVWDAGRSYLDIEAGLYTGIVEDATEAGVLTIMLVGEGERHRRIKYALEGVPGVQVVCATSDTAKLLGWDAGLCVLDEIPHLTGYAEAVTMPTRRGKGERKRNKAERWR